MTAPTLYPPGFEQRFWAKVDRRAEGECWEWHGWRNAKGYGMFRPDWKGNARRVHRLAYELLVGSIPPGLALDHLCRNRACVNPSHLEPVTTRTNTLRGLGPARINALRTVCVNGHPFVERNTYMDKGRRQCRTCHRLRDQRRYREAGSAGAPAVPAASPTDPGRPYE